MCPEFALSVYLEEGIIEDCAVLHLSQSEAMKQIKVGDRVCVRGLLHSDCLGRIGKVLEVRQSALFRAGVQRCKVDFNGKVRRLLSLHLIHAVDRNSSTSAA